MFSLALLGVVCLFNPKVGLVTYYVEKLLRISTGEGRFLFPVLLAYLGVRLIQKSPREGTPQQVYGGIVLFMVSLTVIHLFVPGGKSWGSGLRGEGGGLLGALISMLLWRSFGLAGTVIILTAFALIGIMLVFNWRLNDLYIRIKNRLQTLFNGIKTFLINFLFVEEPEEEKGPHPIIIDFCGDEQVETREASSGEHRGEESSGEKTGSGAVKPVNGGPVLRLVKTPDSRWNQQFSEGYYEPEERNPARGAEYHLPPMSLLSRPSTARNVKASKDITDNIRILEETLESFGVKAKVTQVSRGPAITRYEIQPPPGIKVSRIVSLADDVALSMAAPDVRIEAPIPGKAAVGIEVPNREISTVHLRELLETDEFQKAPSRLTVSLGKDIAGTPVVADLALMPHLLIAGATGSGKSVCLNTLIASMLFKATPEQLKFLIIDPKMVELATYNGIPHLISPVVTDPKKAATSLRWAVKEMEYRYELFASAGVRDITRYNNSSTGREPSRSPLPYIVVIIDELADLMMVAPADVEDSVCRLAQMARAAGIHLMIATQRPSVDVITGLIKANIPSRISFAVSSQIDSRTILDMGGAEKLLGKGDMLFFPVGAAKPVRIQGAYLSDREVEQLVSFWKKQAVPVYLESLTAGEPEAAAAYEPEDELLPRAVEIFIETGHASISMLQRRLHIGYARAARIIDIMERKGIVGSFEGSKPRAVLMTMEQYEQTFNKVGNKNISGN
ncbi:FtsK/SpoIIIE family DNA translocase [Desulfocucumis palustris]|nr:DNA translocase FtsK [Desulfocucumis palustris]